MLDLEFIRNNPDRVKAAALNKGDKADIDGLLALDSEHRRILQQVESLRAQLNAATKEVAKLKRSGQPADSLIEENRALADRIRDLEAQRGAIAHQMEDLLIRVPNVPADDVPLGKSAADNVQVKSWGELRRFDFKPLAHWDLAKMHNLIDFERAAKVAGSNFALFTGDGARLERALINFMLELHTTRHGYTEVSPPYLANRNAMTGTGQLPKLEEDMYRCDADDFFLIPTAEVPLTNLHAGEVLSGERLPIYYTAYSGCFRREAGSYGKETRGLLRIHQFDKVELVKFVRPETSYDELEKLLADAEEVLQLLKLPYRVLKLCTGELSFAAAKCYDIELWAPGVERWLEVSSCSNFEDFQARRADIRFRDKGAKPRYVHTLNGSGVALPRLVIAILENYQNADGTITIPEVIRPYMRGQEVIGNR